MRSCVDCGFDLNSGRHKYPEDCLVVLQRTKRELLEVAKNFIMTLDFMDDIPIKDKSYISAYSKLGDAIVKAEGKKTP